MGCVLVPFPLPWAGGILKYIVNFRGFAQSCGVCSIWRHTVTICFAVVSSKAGTCVLLLGWISAHMRDCLGGKMQYGNVDSPVTRQSVGSYETVRLLFQANALRFGVLAGTLGSWYLTLDFQFSRLDAWLQR